MTLDRWRGTRGVIGWLVLRWDVWQLKRELRGIRRHVLRMRRVMYGY